MIIDLHRHMWSVQERFPDAYAEVPGYEPPPPVAFDWEETTRRAVEEMDSAGIDWSTLFVADFEPRLGPAPFGIDEENRFIAKAGELYPDRIIPFYGIDPRRPGAADRFELAIREWGVRGIKFHPTVGYFPHDRACYPIYELCVSHGIPVLFHSGPGIHPRLYSRYTHPLEYDQVAADFPKLVMIMGHAGGEWWRDCITVAQSHPNMVLELSEWQGPLRDEPEEYVNAIARMRNDLGIERVVWGSDFPGLRGTMPLAECVRVFQELPTTGKRFGVEFTDSDVEAILGLNAVNILGLDQPGGGIDGR